MAAPIHLRNKRRRDNERLADRGGDPGRRMSSICAQPRPTSRRGGERASGCDTREMTVDISEPLTHPSGLAHLEALWRELHHHHLQVSGYQDLVQDCDASWERRLIWYRQLLGQGGFYVTALDAADGLVGYAMVTIEAGPDDTFDSRGGIAEVVTVIVGGEHRASGVGDALLRAAESGARARGAELVKIAVMIGNERARAFCEAHGYSVAEEALYRRIGTG